jgi:hypothetical protein
MRWIGRRRGNMIRERRYAGWGIEMMVGALK